MSERILRALMQLFALVAKAETGSDSGKKVVKVFLEQQLNKELVFQYLSTYDEFFIEGVKNISHIEDYSSKSAKVLTVEETIKILKKMDFVKESLKA